MRTPHPLPANTADPSSALDSLFRPANPADVDALVTAAVGLAERFLATPLLQEFELNPIIVEPQGRSLRVVDALAVARAPGAQAAS